jgi:hypothetical protein
MGYAKSSATMRRMFPALQPLAEGKPCEWDRPSGDADVWAYKLREALFISRKEWARRPLDMELKAFAQASLMFTIQVISPTLVRAVFANPSEIQMEPRPTEQALTPGPAHRISQLQSVEDLQAAWKSAMPSNDPLHFPDMQLSDQDLALAAAWAASLTPAWMILRRKGTNAITLAPDNPNVPAEAKVHPVKRKLSADDRGSYSPEAKKI